MRLTRLVVAGLLLGAAIAFVAALLRPRATTDESSDLPTDRPSDLPTDKDAADLTGVHGEVERGT
jgi:hypothetical protein